MPINKAPQRLSFTLINHRAYQPTSQLTINPINHLGYRPLDYITLSLSNIMPIVYQAYPIKRCNVHQACQPYFFFRAF